MTTTTDSRFWHPFADMGAVRTQELTIDRGEDVWVYDEAGTRYFDATASLWYCNVGHGRPEIAAAVAEQMGRLEAYSAFGDLGNAPARTLADRLAALAPMPDARVFLTSGGGDSIDTAAKLVRRFWIESGSPERDVLLVRNHGYHGTHGYGTSLAGIEANKTSWGPLIGDVSVVPHDDAAALRAEIERVGADRVAAIFMEPVIGAGGVYPPPEGYVQAVAQLCDETGILLVCDSVICGFGRLGTWYGIERFDVEPDLITFAKGVTSGYLPLGGVAVTGKVAAPFFDAAGGPIFRHGATYAGHATCCAAAHANLDLLEQDGLLARGQEMEGPLLAAMQAVGDHPAVGEVRGGMGLMGAVELAPDVLSSVPGAPAKFALGVRAAGALVRPLAAGVAMSPPLTVTQEHLDLLSAALAAGLDGLV